MVRDILTAQISTMLRADIYTVAAMADALPVVMGEVVGLPPTAVDFRGESPCVCSCG